MRHQWRSSMAGPTGLDYNVAHHKLDRAGLSPDEYEQRMDDLMTMESAALTAMSKQNEGK